MVTTKEMEIYVAKFFGLQQTRTGRIKISNNALFIPNVYWDLSHEADVLIMSHSGYLTEVEIKISKSDMLQEFKKRKYIIEKQYRKIKYYYVAFPDFLLPTANRMFPKNVGFLVYDNEDKKLYKIRNSSIMNNYKLSINEKYDLARLLQYRVWKDRFRQTKIPKTKVVENENWLIEHL